jgi:hypothetical protein
MRREALPHGEQSLEPVQGARDIVHVLLDGEAEIAQGETTSSLSPADAIRWSGLRGPTLRIGENGASFLRFALM